jgi:hypothetical protein
MGCLGSECCPKCYSRFLFLDINKHEFLLVIVIVVKICNVGRIVGFDNFHLEPLRIKSGQLVKKKISEILLSNSGTKIPTNILRKCLNS